VDKSTGVRSDQSVILTSFESASAYPDALRRVSYFDAETNKRLKFLTNNFALPALTIAQIYKCRWQVETILREFDMVHSFDVMEFQEPVALNRPLVGSPDDFRSAMQRSTSALRMIHGAPTQACVAGICFNRISRKTVVGVTPRRSPTSLTDISPRACRSPSP